MKKLSLARKMQTIAYSLVFCTFLAGCGTGALQQKSTSAPPQAAQNATVTQLRVGDARANQFEVTVGNPISLIPVGGGTASTIPVNMNRLELEPYRGKDATSGRDAIKARQLCRRRYHNPEPFSHICQDLAHSRACRV